MKRVRLLGRLRSPLWRARFQSFGPGSVVHRPVWISGAGGIAIGRDCILLRPRLIASHPTGDGAALRIGDRVMMRPSASIIAGKSVTIEADVSIASLSTVSDTAHDVAAGAGAATDGSPAPVRIGRGTSIAQRVAVLAGSNVGRYCYLEANSVVSGEIPDYSIATGVPARVVGSTRKP
jgi:acetyltransferase-like isoleucine patch superfamily enzyme